MEKKKFKAKKINTKEKNNVQKAAKGVKRTFSIGGAAVVAFAFVKKHGDSIKDAIKMFK